MLLLNPINNFTSTVVPLCVLSPLLSHRLKVHIKGHSFPETIRPLAFDPLRSSRRPPQIEIEKNTSENPSHFCIREAIRSVTVAVSIRTIDV